MIAADFAQLLHARRVGRGRWTAKCPAHPDRTPSLSIAEGKRRPIVFHCMSQQCDQKAILSAMGLSWADILGPRPITPEIRRRMADQDRLKRLEGRWVTCSMNRVWDARNRNYWAKAAQKLDEEITALAIRMDPSEDRERRMKAAIERYGWDAIWEKFLETSKGKAFCLRACDPSTTPRNSATRSGEESASKSLAHSSTGSESTPKPESPAPLLDGYVWPPRGDIRRALPR